MGQLSPTRSHFQQEVSFWRDVYESDTIEGAVYGSRQRRALDLLDSLRLDAGARVLEVGCGAGWNARELALRNLEVHATDIVEDMLSMTRELAEPRISGRVRTTCCDTQALPYPDETFDAVIGLAVLEWVQTPALALAEIIRVLKPGGRAILSATNLWSLQRIFDPWLNPCVEPFKRWAKTRESAEKRAARARVHSRGELFRLLKLGGLTMEHTETVGYGPFTFFKHKFFQGPRGVRLHRWLERAARAGVPGIRLGGYAHLVMAAKPERRPEDRTWQRMGQAEQPVPPQRTDERVAV
jgi:SAM-dependent methyltransferase